MRASGKHTLEIAIAIALMIKGWRKVASILKNEHAGLLSKELTEAH